MRQYVPSQSPGREPPAVIGDLGHFVSPVSRMALIGGRLLAQAVITVAQSLIVIGLGSVTGASLPGGLLGVAVLIATAIVLGTAFGALSIGLALAVRREESVVAAVQLLPLTFLSSIFMQHDLMPAWISDVAAVNPADWAVKAGRGAVASEADWSNVLTYGAYLTVFALACASLARRAFHLYQRSIWRGRNETRENMTDAATAR